MKYVLTALLCLSPICVVAVDYNQLQTQPAQMGSKQAIKSNAGSPSDEIPIYTDNNWPQDNTGVKPEQPDKINSLHSSS